MEKKRTGVVGDQGGEGREREEARAEGAGEPLQRAFGEGLLVVLGVGGGQGRRRLACVLCMGAWVV